MCRAAVAIDDEASADGSSSYVRLIDRQPSPHTVASLSADLRALGVGAGDVVLLHASRRNVGFVAGGTQAIVHALLDVLASTGTLVYRHIGCADTHPGEHRPGHVAETSRT
jgi:aminoglycoside 3-N-acetyltransferase